jgi:hypothetical protein
MHSNYTILLHKRHSLDIKLWIFDLNISFTHCFIVYYCCFIFKWGFFIRWFKDDSKHLFMKQDQADLALWESIVARQDLFVLRSNPPAIMPRRAKSKDDEVDSRYKRFRLDIETYLDSIADELSSLTSSDEWIPLPMNWAVWPVATSCAQQSNIMMGRMRRTVVCNISLSLYTSASCSTGSASSQIAPHTALSSDTAIPQHTRLTATMDRKSILGLGRKSILGHRLLVIPTTGWIRTQGEDCNLTKHLQRGGPPMHAYTLHLWSGSVNASTALRDYHGKSSCGLIWTV